VADRARRAAENIDRIANAATGDQPAALQFETPLRLVDQIDYDMLHVCEWVGRRRGADTAASLRGRTAEVLTAIHKPSRKARSGGLILDLFAKARQLAYSLRRWAEDIETEDSQPVGEPPAPGDSMSRPRTTVQEANCKAMELARADPAFVQRSLREWADAIGCSHGLVTELPLWQETMRRTGRGRKDKSVAPKAVSLTKPLEAATGEGDKDDVLNQLIAQQEADKEPSPLEDDPPDSRPKRARTRKRV
jgi:hypothetical protein